MWAYRLSRWKNVAFMIYIYQLSQRFPNFVKNRPGQEGREELGPDYDVATHFTPRYKPWEQRLCLVPDADLFEAIKSGRASVVTDQIDTFTENGIRLKSGQELEADIIVTATGLVMQTFGGIELSVDGRTRRSRRDAGLQRRDVFGRAESCLRVRLHQRIVDAQSRLDLRLCMPAVELHGQEGRAPGHAEERRRDGGGAIRGEFHVGLHAARVGELAEAGFEAPWRVYQNYIRDTISLKWTSVDNGALEFSNPLKASSKSAARELAGAAK